MNCTHYSDHEEAPLSQTRTVGLCGYVDSIQRPISISILPPVAAAV